MGEKKIESSSRYNQLVNQTVLAFGFDKHMEQVQKVLSPLNFVIFRPVQDKRDVDSTANFLMAIVDFTNPGSVQNAATHLSSLSNFYGVTLLYAVAPVQLSEQDLLLGVELGVKRTFSGPARDEELRRYVKQHTLEITEHGSMAFTENEVMKAVSKGAEAIRVQLEKLNQMDRESEDVNRLLAVLNEARSDFKRMEFHLKQTLQINPQNLWAANKLGQYYIRHGRVAQGVEILKKLSRFHELNSERLLVLGDAYLNAGRANEAGATLDKGNKLTGGADRRFSEGLAKVDLLKGDLTNALSRLGKKFFSPQIIAFLNTRAIMATRSGMTEEGLKLYQEALHGANPEERVMTAKLYFNLGLAQVRSNNVEASIESFRKSMEIGGNEFNRAKKPLAIAKMIVQKSSGANSQELSSSKTVMDELDFENLH